MLGHHRPAVKRHLMAFHWWADDEPLLAHLNLLSPHQPQPPPKKKQKNKTNKLVKVGPPLAKLSGSAHVLELCLCCHVCAAYCYSALLRSELVCSKWLWHFLVMLTCFPKWNRICCFMFLRDLLFKNIEEYPNIHRAVNPQPCQIMFMVCAINFMREIVFVQLL